MGWATVAVSEVSGSDGEGGGGKGGDEVIAPSSWGWVSMATEGGVEVAGRVQAAVGCEAMRSSNNSNGESTSCENISNEF